MVLLYRLFLEYFAATPGSPTLMSNPLVICDINTSTSQAALHWTQPTDTGGKNVLIDYYLLDVTGPDGFTCPADQCNVTTTNTTITGLLCNTSYTVTVRAVNCRNESTLSQPLVINPPGRHTCTIQWVFVFPWSFNVHEYLIGMMFIH